MAKSRQGNADQGSRPAAAVFSAGPDPLSPPAAATTTTFTGTDDDRPDLPGPAANPLERGELVDGLTEILVGLSEGANERFAAEGSELWLTDEEQARGVARPAANMMLRRVPKWLGSEEKRPDAVDVTLAVMTIFRYGVRQVRTYWRERHAFREEIDARGFVVRRRVDDVADNSIVDPLR